MTKTKYSTKKKIVRLMRIKQEQDELMTKYTNRFETCTELLKNNLNFLANFDETKNLTIKIEAYSKDNEYDTKRVAKTLVKKSKGVNNFDIDSLTTAMK
ncbi:3746_t:CDS:2, partial [Racocetra persica]